MTLRINGATFRIAAILIIGVVTDTDVRSVAAPAVQFAPFKSTNALRKFCGSFNAERNGGDTY